MLREIAAALDAGRSVAVDNTNPSRADRAPVIELARARGARVVAYHVRATTREAVARNEGRAGRARVPKVAIFTVAKRLEPPAADEGFDGDLRRLTSGGRSSSMSSTSTQTRAAAREAAADAPRACHRAPCRSARIGSRVPFDRARRRRALDAPSPRASHVGARGAEPFCRRIRPMLRFRFGASLIALSLVTAACGGGAAAMPPQGSRQDQGRPAARLARRGAVAARSRPVRRASQGARRRGPRQGRQPRRRPAGAAGPRAARPGRQGARHRGGGHREGRRRSSRRRARRRCRSSATTGSFATPTSTSTCRSTT